MSERTVIVHATSLLGRIYETQSPGRRDEQGRPTHALFAFIRRLATAVGFKAPSFAVALLEPGPDPAWDDGLANQHERLPGLLAAHGFSVVRAPRTADLVAGYVRAARAAGGDVVIVGSDKRLSQLVAADAWWYDAIKDARYTPEMVRKRFEVGPEQSAQWLALVGDDATLPGIKGIGKKGATTLLETYGSIEAAIESADEISGRTGNALRAAVDETRREAARATLDPSVALPSELDAMRYIEPDADALQAQYVALGFFELLAAEDDNSNIDICTNIEAIEAGLREMGEGPIGIFAVTDDPSAARGPLVGVALADDESHALYVPFAGPNDVLAGGPAALGRMLSTHAPPKVGHNIKAAVVAFARHGVSLAGLAGDSEHASHLLQPSQMAPHNLPLIARRILRQALPEEDEVRGVGRGRKRWARVKTTDVAAFSVRSARAALRAWSLLAPKCDSALLAEYRDLAATLSRMEQRGIRCDADNLRLVGDDFAAIEADLEEEIFTHAERKFTIGSTKQLGAVLFEDLGLPVHRRTKTGWSTATEALERIEHAHPIVPLVIRWRGLRRLRDTWVTALIAAIDDDGRVRSSFHCARSFSGRLVNSHPDLGRVPGRTAEMQRIRGAFQAAPGSVLMSVDYRQLGLYVLAHLTLDPALVGPLRDDGDIHANTVCAVMGIDPAAVGERERQLGKVINFATFASQGASALALQLGCTPAEAKDIIERFNETYAVVRAFQDEQLRLARERGYIETIAGRHWPIGGLDSPDIHERSYAERLARRATHEGSVSDVGRRGLLRADEALRAAGLQAAPLLQILDEVLFEVPTDELEEARMVASRAMRDAFTLHVPLRVGVKTGPSWADLT